MTAGFESDMLSGVFISCLFILFNYGLNMYLVPSKLLAARENHPLRADTFLAAMELTVEGIDRSMIHTLINRYELAVVIRAMKSRCVL